MSCGRLGALAALLSALSSASCGHPAVGAAPQVALPASAKLLPVRVRRLTNLELERSLAALLERPVSLSEELPPDVRQEGYTPNAKQDVSATWATRYSAIVDELTQPGGSPPRLPCRDFAAPSCRARVTEHFGRRALRRPLEAAELQAYAELLHQPAPDVALSTLLRAFLEAPSFLYVSELGDRGAGPRVHLDDYEQATLMAYTLRGGPPDDELLRAADEGKLRDPRHRVDQARRLLAQSDTRLQFRRFVLEWLEVDGLLQTAKSSERFPSYDALKPFMLRETESYVDEVMVHGGASVASLLGAGFASVGPEMARFYGLRSYGPRASLRGSGRLGLLQQASFLAAHAHEDVTSPVKRGDFVLRKLLCENPKRPAEVGIEVVMPPPARDLSNRERMSRHVADPDCASCHETLDAIGFSFESFDAMGGLQTTDHGKPVDSRVRVKLGATDSGLRELGSSADLTRALIEKPSVSECFARHAFRYFTAQADPEVEATFLRVRSELDESRRDNLLEVLIAYIGSDLFAYREASP